MKKEMKGTVDTKELVNDVMSIHMCHFIMKCRFCDSIMARYLLLTKSSITFFIVGLLFSSCSVVG
jgi:hypothetical protein